VDIPGVPNDHFLPVDWVVDNAIWQSERKGGEGAFRDFVTYVLCQSSLK
jgi:3-deoxy-D-manno-octulosonate 8-phosphate phosphatase KdsC-like HAD superfamily phosphatase